jgi:hypothetical protein
MVTKKRILCRLKRCLGDFKTKDHLCLFPDPFLLNFFPKWFVIPPSVGFGLFICFFLSSLGQASSYQLFLWVAQIFWILWIFFIMPQLFVGNFDHWVFSFMPPSVIRALLRFFLCLSHLAPSAGCDLMQWGSIGLTFKRVCKMIYSFK